MLRWCHVFTLLLSAYSLQAETLIVSTFNDLNSAAYYEPNQNVVFTITIPQNEFEADFSVSDSITQQSCQLILLANGKSLGPRSNQNSCQQLSSNGVGFSGSSSESTVIVSVTFQFRANRCWVSFKSSTGQKQVELREVPKISHNGAALQDNQVFQISGKVTSFPATFRCGGAVGSERDFFRMFVFSGEPDYNWSNGDYEQSQSTSTTCGLDRFTNFPSNLRRAARQTVVCQLTCKTCSKLLEIEVNKTIVVQYSPINSEIKTEYLGNGEMKITANGNPKPSIDVQYGLVDTQERLTAQAKDSGQLILSNLEFGKDYSFTIKATNALGSDELVKPFMIPSKTEEATKAPGAAEDSSRTRTIIIVVVVVVAVLLFIAVVIMIVLLKRQRNARRTPSAVPEAIPLSGNKTIASSDSSHK